MGAQSNNIARAAQEQGVPIPDLEPPVDLTPRNTAFYTAFWELSTERYIGFGLVGPIPWSAKDRYAERYGFLDDEIHYDDFMHVMSAMDEAFIEHQKKRADEQTKKHAARSTGRGARRARRN